MHCMTSIELSLKRNYPYLKNLSKVFLTKCLSLNLMKFKPLNVEEFTNKDELLKVLTSMDNDETPGNDGITK